MKRIVLLLCLIAATVAGCSKTRTGDKCGKTSQCMEKNVCFAEVCVEHGSKHFVDITLLATDHDELACAIDADVAGLSCRHAYDQSEKTKRPAREDPRQLQPVTTKGNITLLAAGLWNQPALASKLAKGKSDARFIARCEVVIRGTVEKARVRWKRGEGWLAATHVPVVVANACTIAK